MIPSVVYIGGYGRSGSTILERVLSAHPAVEGLGELEYLTRNPELEDTSCGCGELLTGCPIWGPILRSTLRNEIPQIRAAQDRCDGPRLHSLLRPRSPSARRYRGFLRHLIERVTAQFRELPQYVIDSSKTSIANWLRPFTLRAALPKGSTVKLVHLVRDGRGCMWSYVEKGSNRRIERGKRPHVRLAALRSAVNWFFANLFSELYGFCFPNDYLRVRYEDLVSAPVETLENIGIALGLDFTEQARTLSQGGPLPALHQVAGNRLRTQNSIRLRTDETWRRSLSLRRQLLFWLLDWPFALRYGYHHQLGQSHS